jgi:hypothetical protein
MKSYETSAMEREHGLLDAQFIEISAVVEDRGDFQASRSSRAAWVQMGESDG